MFTTVLYAVMVLAISGVAVLRFYLYSNDQTTSAAASPEFKRFQRNYLLVYYIVMFADWLQGPYVYALYDSYGFNIQDIAVLFIAGFGSSMIFGTVVGSLADKYGRRLLAMVFCISYGVGCITKLSSDFYVLLLGRFLSGIATSLLFSVFESWMVHEHHARSFDSAGLSKTFSYGAFGNSIAAILAGVVATSVASKWGFVAPFMMSLLFLLIALAIIFFTWTENYGDSKIEVTQTFVNAYNAIKNDRSVALIGLVQGLFEGSMYVFVFMWTPTLERGEKAAFSDASQGLHGLVFACFMISVMFGSSLFEWLSRSRSLVLLGQAVLIGSTISLALPIVTSSSALIFIGFNVFESLVGVYWPAFGTLRAQVIPEETRSAIMNYFRIPLNLLVVLILFMTKRLSIETIFLICTIWLLLAIFLFGLFAQAKTTPSIQSSADPENGENIVEDPSDDQQPKSESDEQKPNAQLAH